MSQTGQCSYCLQNFPESDLVVVDIISVKLAAAGADPWTYLGAVCSKCRIGDLDGKWRDVKKRPDPALQDNGFWKISGTGKRVRLTREQFEEERAKAEGRLGSFHPQPRHTVDPNAALDQFNL